MTQARADKASQPYYGIFNDSFPPIIDGVTLTVENYVHWLNEKGMPACVVTPWNPQKIETPYEVMKFFSLPIYNRKPYRYGYPKLDPFIWYRLRRTPFRLVHSHCPFSSGRLAVYVKKRQGVPLIGTFHSKYRTDLEHSFRKMPWCVPIIMKRILAFFNACDEVWIPQAQVEDTVREYGYTGPLQVVANGIDYADCLGMPLEQFREESRRSIGTADDELGLLFVGQHIREKGILLIADALKLLGQNVKFRMNFVGNGYALSELRGRIESYGLSDRVKIHGIVTDRRRLSQFYAGSDLFLFPSFYDNAPLVLREAAAMATPGILLRGSTASEVIHTGENGFLTGNSAEDYANLILRLNADRGLISSAGEAARATLVRSWKNVVDEVIDRYGSILRRHESGAPKYR